eukprot:gene9138-410_t
MSTEFKLIARLNFCFLHSSSQDFSEQCYATSQYGGKREEEVYRIQTATGLEYMKLRPFANLFLQLLQLRGIRLLLLSDWDSATTKKILSDMFSPSQVDNVPLIVPWTYQGTPWAQGYNPSLAMFGITSRQDTADCVILDVAEHTWMDPERECVFTCPSYNPAVEDGGVLLEFLTS